MKWALALALLAFVVGPLCAASAVKSKTHPVAHSGNKPASSAKATLRQAASTKPSGKNRTASSHAVSARGRGKTGRRTTRAASGPAVQSHPDTERYQQIQQALTERGYYKGEVNGEWNADSVEALKHFQADQKLEPDGKVNSWSLINLGLGPKHDSSTVASTAAPPNPIPAAPPSN
jgi:Putative peptidoglycan binding domain